MALVTGVLMLGAAVLSVAGFRFGLFTWHFSQLKQYQFDKLDHANALDILLVGDSSLGNAVDAKAWSEALQRPVLSLALTGTYGYGGSLNLIRRALRRHTPKTIIVFNTVKLMAREESGQGALFTARNLSDLDLVQPSALWKSLINLAMPINVAGTVLLRPRDRSADYLATDYVPQAPPLSQTQRRPRLEIFSPSGLVPDHQRFLSAIGAICKQHAIQCLYMHGPLGEWGCLGSMRFVAAVNERVRAAGLSPVATTPLCISWQDIGDAEDHVSARAKAKFSAGYLSLVEPLLK